MCWLASVGPDSFRSIFNIKEWGEKPQFAVSTRRGTLYEDSKSHAKRKQESNGDNNTFLFLFLLFLSLLRWLFRDFVCVCVWPCAKKKAKMKPIVMKDLKEKYLKAKNDERLKHEKRLRILYRFRMQRLKNAFV